jgi:hypothetical protein
MAYVLSKQEALTYAPSELKIDFTKMLKGIDEKLFFADNKWTKSNNSQWNIKTSASNVDLIKKNFGGGTFLPNISYLVEVRKGYKIKFLISKKTASAGGADAQTTRMQELGSAWIMRRALNDNVSYKDWQSIRKDPKYNELKKIYPGVDESPDWLQTFFGQQKKMLEKFSNAEFTEFNREGGFMQYISDLVKTKYGISKKDTWNPADIWCIKNQDKVIKTFKENVEGSKLSQTIEELNAIQREMFKSKQVVGISLKKLSGQIAKYEEYNLDEASLYPTFNFKLLTSAIDLRFDKKFGTQDARIIVTGEGVAYNFQIKGNDTAKVSNLKWEPTASGSTAARVGKAPVEMVAALMKDNKMDFINDNKLFPQNANEFKKEKTIYIQMFKTLQSKRVETKIANSEDFVKNITLGFNIETPIAVSKLMQLKFLDELFKLTEKKRNEFVTDLVFLAAKIGEKFGPFGKIY